MVTDARETRWSTRRMAVSGAQDVIIVHGWCPPSSNLDRLGPEARMALKQQLKFARGYARSAVVARPSSAPPVMPAPYHPVPVTWPDDRLTVSWLGHATVLLNFHGAWLLTDPALERRIGI